MSEYIKREDVVAAIESLPFAMSVCDSVDECHGMRKAQKFIASIVAESIPAADVVERPRWIPVTERLPLYGQDVLAVRTYWDGEKYQEVLTAHIAVWNEDTGEKWWNATNITHWMPLPKPPKEVDT